MGSSRLVRFCRLRLGLKPVFDYVEARTSLLGLRRRPIRTVFDIGANVGKKARLYRKLFPQAMIYCFEPVPACYQQLSQWASGQQGKVRTFNMALAAEPGEMEMQWNVSHPGGSTLMAASNKGREDYVAIRVKVDTLDAVSAGLDCRDDILVKIDVEGFDLEVIRGGRRLLERASAAIVEIGVHETQSKERPAFIEFVRALDELGLSYRGNLSCAWVEGIPHLVDAVFSRPATAEKIAA